jgi:hypothetical protein
MSTNLNLDKLINIIEDITPYYYVPLFNKKIKKLIDNTSKFNNENNKIIYLMNNLNDMHFSLNKNKEPIYPNYSCGFIIIYTKKNGEPFTSDLNGKYIYIYYIYYIRSLSHIQYTGRHKDENQIAYEEHKLFMSISVVGEFIVQLNYCVINLYDM